LALNARADGYGKRGAEFRSGKWIIGIAAIVLIAGLLGYWFLRSSLSSPSAVAAGSVVSNVEVGSDVEIGRDVEKGRDSGEGSARPEQPIDSGATSTPAASQSTADAAAQSIQAEANADAAKVKAVNSTVAQPVWSASEQKLIDDWGRLNDLCRGGAGSADATEQACASRDLAGTRLDHAGICYGKTNDQAAVDARMHRCGPESEHLGRSK
jgi:hypothetical protein